MLSFKNVCTTRFHFIAPMLPLAFLLGCATSPQAKRPTFVDRPVVGSGNSDDRAAIDSSNQQIFNAEHAATPDSPPPPSGESQSPP